jgi:PmbA protein
VLEALRLASKAGATDAEVSAHTSQGLSVNARLGEVETLEHMQDRGVSVSVYIGNRKGNASSADLRNASIESCVRHAIDIARYTQEDKSNGLADSALLATEFPDLDLWHPMVLDASAAIDRALACEASGLASSKINNSEGGSFSAGLGLGVYGNSSGFIGRSAGTRFSQSCVLLAGKGEGMQRDYSYDSRRCFGDLESPETTGAEAARRTLSRLGARQLATAEMPVLFAPDVAKGLVGHLVGAISGAALYRNASFLKDQAGEVLFPDWVNIIERPALLRGAGSASFDSEGVATKDRRIIDSGTLEGYVLSSYSARRLGLETTGNAGGVRNLLLEPGGERRDDLIRQMRDGLYVTDLMGQGVSMVTGDYSRGASGFRVENGEVTYPVEEVTIAGNLRDIFNNVVAAGEDIDTRGNTHAGSVLISKMMVAGA